VPGPKADGVPLLCESPAREEVFREEPEGQIASFVVSVPILGLNAGAGSQFQLYKSVGDIISLVSVDAKPIRRKVSTTNAEGKFLVDA
jgi:hypothetical protein